MGTEDGRFSGEKDLSEDFNLIVLFSSLSLLYIAFVVAGTFLVCLPHVLCGCGQALFETVMKFFTKIFYSEDYSKKEA